MRGNRWYSALTATLLLSACAGAPEQVQTPQAGAAVNAPAASTTVVSAAAPAGVTEPANAAAPTGVTEPANAAAPASAPDPADAAAPATPIAPVIVDANQLAATTPPITCRDMLRRGSNVIVQRCMTEAEWKRYERQEAHDAGELVRALQGGRYR